MHLAVHSEVAAVFFQLLLKDFGSISVFTRQEFVTSNDESDLGAEALECLSKLSTDWTSSYDNHTLGLRHDVENVVRSMVRDRVDAIDLRNVWSSSSGDAGLVEGQFLAIDFNLVLGRELRVAHVHIDSERRRESLG